MAGVVHVHNEAAVSVVDVSQDSYVHLEGYGELSLNGTAGFHGNWNRQANSSVALAETPVVQGYWKRTASSVIAADSQLSYVGPHNLSAASSLTLTDAAHLCQSLAVSATGGLALGSVVSVKGTAHLTAKSELGLESWADPPARVRQIASTIVLAGAADASYCHTASTQLTLTDWAEKGQKTASASSTLALVQSGRLVVTGREAATALVLAHSVKTNIHMPGTATTLSIAGMAACRGPQWASAFTLLQTTSQGLDADLQPITLLVGLQDSATVAHATHLSTPVQYLDPKGIASVVHLREGAISLSASSQIALDYDLARNKTGQAQTTISMSQSDVAHRCKPAESDLALSSAAVSQTRLCA